ncbi:class I SAM-dependent methyltransferase [Bacillus sp. MUM 13]|uniref:class I SAM-dependent methyltransferase n=1 Tax=Bacillus sp. MUM 13 TaxID=1678001 RepID=UPI0008F5ED67|nr:class I SAM-dependent methyltransferase [Bacillus sp. MUM 13]OIK07440.1 methyltransferase [Bacillus sp. MUM 13]
MNQDSWHGEAEKLWNSYSDQWKSNSGNMWEKGSRKDILPLITKHVQKGAEVCDLGCGDGYGSLKLAEAGFKVAGMDFSKDMITAARELAKGHGNPEFIQGDLAAMPFHDEQFDAAMAINSIEWTESPLMALKEMNRILKKDAIACIGILGPAAAPRKAHSYRRLYGEKTIMNSMMPWEFERLSLENGWKLVDEMAVVKKGAETEKIAHLPKELKQAVSFMWLFILKKCSGDEKSE